MLHCVSWLQKSIEEKYDEFGDPYFKLSSVEDLKHILSTMQDTPINTPALTSLRAELEEEVQLEGNIFRGESFYLRKKENDH